MTDIDVAERRELEALRERDVLRKRVADLEAAIRRCFTLEPLVPLAETLIHICRVDGGARPYPVKMNDLDIIGLAMVLENVKIMGGKP